MFGCLQLIEIEIFNGVLFFNEALLKYFSYLVNKITVAQALNPNFPRILTTYVVVHNLNNFLLEIQSIQGDSLMCVRQK